MLRIHQSPTAYLCRGDILFKIKIKYSFIFLVVSAILMLKCQVMLCAVICICIHEASHIISSKFLGYEVRSFEFHAQGLSIDLDKEPKSVESIIILSSGPLANLICSVMYMAFTDNPNSAFVIFNLSFGLFNLIPLRFLDGGRLLENLLQFMFSPTISKNLFTFINYFMLFIVWTFSIYCFLFSNSHNASLFFCIFTLINLCINDIF